MGKGFDEYAPAYDAWFLENRNVLYSEINLVAHVLKNPGRTLSVGCGSGLFETILAKEYGITITDGIEPSEGMAEIARKRGMKVTISTAEEADFGCGDYDTILFNGTPSYITDLESVVRKAYDALPEGGRIILIDVPKESTYGVLYNLAKALGTWDHPLLEKAGFRDLRFAQTLTTHPLYSNRQEEQPSEGYEKGDYVAVTACK